MKRNAGIIFRSLLLLLIGVIIGFMLNDNSGQGISTDAKDKISRSLHLVKKYYVDSVNVDSIEGVTVNNILQNLDPHSLYLPPQQAESINEKLDGGFNGFGIEYQLLRDTPIITQVYNGGPAQQAGIATGNRVISINNKFFAGSHLTPKIINSAFRDEKNPTVALSILTDDKNIKTYHLKRSHVDLSSLDAAYMVAPATGYIKISKFAATTDADFRASLIKLKAGGMKKLVLDLRGNGGGYLNSATELASEFLNKGKLIVYTKGVHEQRKDYFATDSGLFQQGKLAVLIDEYSASASEILAGALQDFDRAVIVGRRSFGKGLVQQQFGFDDGSAVNLTVARYYTPSGRSIQKSYKGGADSYRNELAERMQKGELFSEQSYFKDSTFKSTCVYHTSGGRKVFSGGGIMPDVFVAADTTGDTPLVQQLDNQQLFNAYVIDKMPPVLKAYDTDDSFLKRYHVSDDQFNDFILYASQTLKEMDSNDVRNSKDGIKSLLKAFAARYKWGNTAYYQAINSDDAALKRAVAAVN